MKVISVLQPWATLIIIGAKKIETRSWNTKYRGEILIHASKAKTNNGLSLFHSKWCWDKIPQLSNKHFVELPFGAIIGKVNLCATSILVSPYGLKNGGSDGIYFNDKGAHFTDQELAFGDYSDGRYGWLLSDPVQFDIPIPAKGQLSIWNYDLKSAKNYE